MNPLLQSVLQRPDVWQASQPGQQVYDSLPSGHQPLDKALHYRGWPRSSLIELCTSQSGVGEMELLLPGLAACCDKPGWLFFIAPPYLPFPPALWVRGIDPARLLIAAPDRPDDILWAAEQALLSGACVAVVAWLPRRGLRYPHLRRLQLACRRGDVPGFFFRPSLAIQERSPATVRLYLQAQQQGLKITINKQPGGHAGQTVTIARDASLLRRKIPSVSLPSLTSVDLYTGTPFVTAGVDACAPARPILPYKAHQIASKQ